MTAIDHGASGVASQQQRAQTAVPREELHLSVLFMFFSLAAMITSLSVVFFAPMTFMFPICLGTYGLLVMGELSCRIRSPVSLSLLGIYAVLAAIAAVVPGGEQIRPYTGIVIFSWLALLLTFLLAIGRPFTTFYSGSRSMPSLHRATSLVWISVYLLGAAASVALMPSVLYIYVPAGLCLAGAATNLIFNLVWFGPSNVRQREFSSGPLTIRQISFGTPEFDELCRFFSRESTADRQSLHPNHDESQWYQNVRESEEQIQQGSVAFVAFHGAEMVGSVRCLLDRPPRRLKLETDIDTSLDGIRRIGRLIYIGRLAITEAYRKRPELVGTLFKCMIDLALENDVSFVVTGTFTNRVPTFLKLGFEALFPMSDPRHTYINNFGFESCPLILNLARRAFTEKNKTESTALSAPISRFLQERWYKRAILRYRLRPRVRRPWEQSLESLRAALPPAGPSTGAG